MYLKSGDYQEGDSLAIYDFDGGAAVATSTPLAASSGDNSAVDVSHGEQNSIVIILVFHINYYCTMMVI